MRGLVKIFFFRFLFAVAVVGGIFSTPTTAEAQHNTWGKINQGRFQALANFFNFAVLDRETGLIWQSCPAQFSPNDPTWTQGMHDCWNASTGGRDGWRVPTIVELRSLGAYNPNFQLPNTAPFCNQTTGEYWTSTASLLDANAVITLSDNGTTTFNKPKSGTARIWCVRGGTGH